MPGELSSIVGIEVKTNERTDFPAVARAVPQIISLTFLELPLSGQARLALYSQDTYAATQHAPEAGSVT
jgi:hypothetical protein